MGKTSIEWTDASWNPVTGCEQCSPGCANCYAARLAATRLKNVPEYHNLAVITPQGSPRWSGEVRFHRDRLEEPLHWRAPRRIFVCDMADLFFGTPWAWIHEIFGVIARCPQHTFQILTKRAERMKALMSLPFLGGKEFGGSWPLPNVWLGVSVENQHFANERIPLLLDTPAAVRWISCEPLLAPLDLMRYLEPDFTGDLINGPCQEHRGIDWVVCGGESGPNARPMNPVWARSLRDQCLPGGAAAFFFKQWGEWIPRPLDPSETWKIKKGDAPPCLACFDPNGRLEMGSCGSAAPGWEFLNRVGKKAAGRLLDGREYNEFPKPNAVEGNAAAAPPAVSTSPKS